MQKSIINHTIKKGHLKSVMQKTLVGLQKFVSAIAKDELQNWLPNCNVVAQNGDFVHHVHMTHMITDPVLADSSFSHACVTEIYTDVQHKSKMQLCCLLGIRR